MLTQLQKTAWVAAFACVLIGFGWVSWSATKHQKQQSIQHSRTKEPDNKASKVSTDERIADYTWWLAVLTGALVLVSGIQGYFLLRADKTARIAADASSKSADVVEKTLIASQRPWVSLQDARIRGPLQFGNAGAFVTVEFDLKNTGNSPALELGIEFRVFPLYQKTSRIADVNKGIRDRLSSRDDLSGIALFPGDTQTLTQSTSILRAELDEGSMTDVNGTKKIFFMLAGYIDYGFILDRERHQTGFWFALTGPQHPMPVPLNGDIYPVILSRNPMGETAT